MLDLAFVRQHLDVVEQKLRDRGISPDAVLGDFRRLEEERRDYLTALQNLQERRNKIAAQVAALKKEERLATSQAVSQPPLTELTSQAFEVKSLMADRERKAKEKDAELRLVLAGIPNLPHESVPVGSGPEQNREVRRWGQPPSFGFTPKSHWELGEQLGVLDLERAAKLSGARFAVYWDLGAKLERALANFMLDLHTREHGYIEVLPPYMVNSQSMYGTGQLPKFAADLFQCKDSDLWLIPTAEVPLTNLYRDEVIDAARLPLSVTAYTPCFRSEAGSYGKDVRGIIRQHQFQKVELVKFTRPEDSYQQLEKLTCDAETVLQRLGLHYRVVTLCTGDMGFSASKTYDLEVWLPGQQLFREISSCSNFEAFQARRANIRWRPEGKGKSEFVHTLNGSGLAIGRTWVAIVENYQQADGSVLIPEVLCPYVGAERITPKKF